MNLIFVPIFYILTSCFDHIEPILLPLLSDFNYFRFSLLTFALKPNADSFVTVLAVFASDISQEINFVGHPAPPPLTYLPIICKNCPGCKQGGGGIGGVRVTAYSCYWAICPPPCALD